MRRLTVTAESFPIAGTFTISRGSKYVGELEITGVMRPATKPDAAPAH